MKKSKIRLDRIIIIIVIAIIVSFGVYKGVSFAMGLLNSQPEEEVVVEEKSPYLATIVLDAGHGGTDAGAVKGNLYEKDINLKTVLALGKSLEKEKIKVIYARTTDTTLNEDRLTDLRMRAALSEKNKADYYVAIHVNSSAVRNDISGFEIYTKKSEGSQTLGKAIAASFEKLNYSPNRGLQDGNTLAVLRQNTAPAVLVELGYINGKDINYLSDDNKVEKMASAISEGIVNLVKTKK